ncbi:MAG TPA: hypothetical protein VGL71_08385, partial [Urbifossiella sp.]
MWTPRRVLLLLGGILLFSGVYGSYSRFLGWLDGLPQLPAKMLDSSPGQMLPRVRITSPTIEHIREAFGPDCLEQHSAYYPTQLERINADNSFTVLASGSPPSNDGSKSMVLAPFSMAMFGAPKPQHQLQPGEVVEIHTFHADKAILEFDRPVSGPMDMAKAKLLRMELISEPDPAHLRIDRRCGTIHITANQRSSDPSKFLLIRTVGPLFYRDPKSVDAAGLAGPDIWTNAAVEIIDRQNLPRRFTLAAAQERYRTFAVATNPLLRAKGVDVDEAETAIVKGPDLQSAKAVQEILLGQRLPPPTVSAIGMKIFLEQANQPPPKDAPPKKKTSALGGFRRVELLEKVLVNLWVDSQQGLMQSEAPPQKPGTPAAKPPEGPRPEAPLGLGALAGGLLHSSEYVHKLSRALLQIDTLGRLIYETQTATAHFDVLPDGNPELPNDVQVHRVTALGAGLQELFSQFLEIEFYGAPIGAAAAAQPAGEPKAEGMPKKPPEPTGTSFRRLRAWVEMPERFVTISSEPDRLRAFGQYLLHDKETSTTTLRGTPLTVVSINQPNKNGKAAGENKLTAGTRDVPAVLTLKPGAGSGLEKSTDAIVEGPGRLELFDEASGAN